MPNGNSAFCCYSCRSLDRTDPAASRCRRYGEPLENPAAVLCRSFALPDGHGPLPRTASAILRALPHGVLVCSTGHDATDFTPVRPFKRKNVEDRLVDDVHDALGVALPDRFVVRRAANLYYEILVDEALRITADPRKPVRGQSAFQTDLCIFERGADGVELPRVVLEFKGDLTTHDVLTYSAKAARHRTVYPYLRYGIVLARPSSVPRRFFTHNDALDFCVAVGDGVPEQVVALVHDELEASQRMQALVFRGTGAALVRRSWADAPLPRIDPET
jgi:hypothetical protein